MSLSIESGYRSITETASKRLEYIGFLEREFMDEVNRDILRLIVHPDRRDAGALSNIVTFSRRLQDKLVNFANPLDSELVSMDGS